MNPSILLVLLGTLVTTSYRSIPAQTDSTPFITSTGETVSKYGCAVSQDLLCPLAHGKHRLHNAKTCPFKNRLHYGDWLYVEGYGLRCVNDVMHPRMKRHIDLWVATYKEEKSVGLRRIRVYSVKGI